MHHQKEDTSLSHPRRPINVTIQCHTIALDLITQLPEANGYDTILTIMDQGCSQAAIFIPCHTMITREGIAMSYLKNVFPWFRVPSKVISDRDPQFMSHFVQALTTKLSIRWNISTTFHPQTDGLTERKNQWVEQYLCLYTSARQDNWDVWLPIATFVHNQWPNTTTKQSPHELLLGYCPSAAEEPTNITNNETIEERHQLIKQHREAALKALDKVTQMTPPSQYRVGEWVWLEAKYLTLPYASAKLAPKRRGPFQIMKEVSPVAYQLALQRAWMIHNVFHSSLLTRYKETHESGAQFQHPPPELVGNEEEYEVEQIINHHHFGKHRQLQYLICWKGYSAVDDTWEPADQVHTNDLVKKYHMKYVKEGEGHKSQQQMRIKTTILSSLTCPQPTLQTSPLPLPPALQSTWTLLNPSQSDRQLRLQWSIARSPSPSPPPLRLSLRNSVSSSYLPGLCTLLSKDIGTPGGRNSSSSHMDWLELHTRIKKSAVTTKNNLRSSNSKVTIWQNAKWMQLAWKKPTNTGPKTPTRGTWSGRKEGKLLRGMRKMKDTSSISSFWSPTVTTPCMSLPPTSSWTASTAWALSASMSPSTGMNFFHPNESLSTKRESSLIGSSPASSMTHCTQPCTTTQEPRKTGGSRLSSNGTMRCMLKLLPWSQSKGVWPLPSRQLRSNWTRASDASSVPMPTSGTNYSMPSMRALTSTQVQEEVHLYPWKLTLWCGLTLIGG